MVIEGDKRDIKPKGTMMRNYGVAEAYKILEKVGRGTYGTVYKAKGVKDGRMYAIKKLENNDSKLQQQGFPITALREITLLKQIDHPNIIKLKEIIVSRPNKRNYQRGSTFLVFEYMDHDFAGLFKQKIKYSLPEIKCIFKQLLEGVAYLHRNKIFHRDIKSANILLNDDGEVKLADFGLGRKVRFESFFTYKVVTLWYRAPQLLLGCKSYSDKIDVWSLGCVIVEFFTGDVLFKKQTEYAQMQRIYEVMGDFEANQMVVNEEFAKIYQNYQDLRPRKQYSKDIATHIRKYCPSVNDTTIDFIERLLHLDPSKRMSCEQALRHPFFSQKPLACSKAEIQKMDYEFHEMFKDKSVKIERPLPTKRIQEDQLFKTRHGDHSREEKSYAPRSRKEDSLGYDRHEDKYYRDKKPRDDYRYEEKRYYHHHHSRSYSKRSRTYSSSSPDTNSRRSHRSRSRYDRKEDDKKYRHQYHHQDTRYEKRYDHYQRRREEREDRRKEEKGDRRKEDIDDKYSRSPLDKKYKSREDQPRRDYPDRKRDYREDKYSRKEQYQRRSEKREERFVPQKREERFVPQKREEKIIERRSEKRQERIFERRDDIAPERREERRSQKRDERKVSIGEKRQERLPLLPERREQRSFQKRPEKRSDRREDRGSEIKQDHKDYGYQSKEKSYLRQDKKYDLKDGKHYDEKDYKKRDDKYSRGSLQQFREGSAHRDERRHDKYAYSKGRNQYKKRDDYSISSEGSSRHHRRDKDYRHHRSTHYDRAQSKHYYKNQPAGSHDRRNN